MNPLSQLVSDLDLDETLVRRKLIVEGLAEVNCRSLDEIADSDCPIAIDLVMKVLRETS